MTAERDAAVAEMAAAHDRLTLLAEAGRVLSGTLEVTEQLAELTELVVPALGDWCWIVVADESNRLRELASAHSDPARAAELDPGNDLYRQSLVYTHSRAGYAFAALLDYPAAGRHAGGAADRAAEGRRRNPGDRGWEQRHSATLIELALVEQNLGRAAAAEAHAREGTAWFDAAAAAGRAGLVSLGSLFTEPVWLFLREESGVRNLLELRGKRINLGPEGTGVPRLVLQGTRDTFGSAAEVTAALAGAAGVRLVPLDGADHGGRVPRVAALAGPTASELRGRVVTAVAGFVHERAAEQGIPAPSTR